jgi:hypothetical protein
MKLVSRLALAALLTGGVILPAFAQADHASPAPRHHVTNVADSMASKPDATKPVTTKSTTVPAVKSGQTGSTMATGTAATGPMKPPMTSGQAGSPAGAGATTPKAN